MCVARNTLSFADAFRLPCLQVRRVFVGQNRDQVSFSLPSPLPQETELLSTTDSRADSHTAKRSSQPVVPVTKHYPAHY